ncbi:MAG: TetR/AcrR family transcriptional regulator [Chloroflexi bacterium]|nr:TetR/AcrR family transcriptional regulator [Chloroflexota bacterium]
MSKQERGDLTRRRILQAARTSFNQRGYDATGVADICKQAGVSKGGFYHHFPSKQALFIALLQDWLNALDTQITQLAAHDTPPALILQHLTEIVTPLFEEAAGQVPMFLEFWNKAARDSEVWQATIEPYHRYRNIFAEMIQQGMADGDFRQVDAQMMATGLVALGIGLLLQASLDQDGMDWGKTAEQIIQTFLKGLEPEEAI